MRDRGKVAAVVVGLVGVLMATGSCIQGTTGGEKGAACYTVRTELSTRKVADYSVWSDGCVRLYGKDDLMIGVACGNVDIMNEGSGACEGIGKTEFTGSYR